MGNQTVILACPTLAGELKEAMKEAQSDSVVYFMPPGLHRDPKVLHHYVQDKIDHFYNVSKIVVCTTGCGGGNIGITASSAPLLYPKTRDCIDILLSGDSLADLKRDMHGVFLTESWMEFMKESSIDMEKLEKKMGRDEAHGYLKKLYAPIHDFYIIDTGCYDVEPVKKYIEPMVDLLQADLHMVHGGYGILRKIAGGTFDDDFFVVPKGGKGKARFFSCKFLIKEDVHGIRKFHGPGLPDSFTQETFFKKKRKKVQKGFGKIGLYTMILFHFLPFLPINDKSHHSLDKKEDGGYTN